MPHENINSASGTFGRVQIIWKPAGNVQHAYAEAEEGYVQVLSEDPESSAIFPGKPPEVANEAYPAGQTPGQPDSSGDQNPESSNGYPSSPCTGFAVMLDRDGINRAIRLLRRARDAAFGSDA